MTSSAFKWKHYEATIILLTIRWYLKYPLSYRNLVEMMSERGLDIAHTTIMRWVHQYSPELDKKTRMYLRLVQKNNKSFNLSFCPFALLVQIAITPLLSICTA